MADDEAKRQLKELFDDSGDDDSDDDAGVIGKGVTGGGGGDDGLNLGSSSSEGEEADDDDKPQKRKRLQKGKKDTKTSKQAFKKGKSSEKPKGKSKKLSKRKGKGSDSDDEEVQRSGKRPKPGDPAGSGDDYDSGEEAQRTRDDDDFIVDDEENLKELGLEGELTREARFADERPDGHDSGADDDSIDEDRRFRGKKPIDPNNPLEVALANMKSKRKKGKLTETLPQEVQEQITQDFLYMMQKAAQSDADNLKAGKAALEKVKLLPKVVSIINKKDLQILFLDFDLLGVMKLWIQPLEDGTLPNLSIRTAMLDAMAKLPVDKEHLKRSGMGKVIGTLWKHPQETPDNKLKCQKLIEKWSRPVFDKSTDYRKLSQQGEGSIFMKSANLAMKRRPSVSPRGGARDTQEGSNPLSGINVRQSGTKGEQSIRARVPQARSMDFVAMPVAPSLDNMKSRKPDPESRKGKLIKKMQNVRLLAKKKASRSVKMSIEGRKV